MIVKKNDFWIKQKELEKERAKELELKVKRARKEGKNFNPIITNKQEQAVERAYKFLLGESKVIREPVLKNKTSPDYLINSPSGKISLVEVKDKADAFSTFSSIKKYGRCFVQAGGKSGNLIIVPFAPEVKEARKAVQDFNAKMEEEKTKAEARLEKIESELNFINKLVLSKEASEEQIRNVWHMMNEYSLKQKKMGKSKTNGLANKVSREQKIVFSNNNLEAERERLLNEKFAVENKLNNSNYHKAFIVPAENVRVVTTYFAKKQKDPVSKAEGYSVADQLLTEIKSSEERQSLSPRERSAHFRKNVIRKYKND